MILLHFCSWIDIQSASVCRDISNSLWSGNWQTFIFCIHVLWQYITWQQDSLPLSFIFWLTLNQNLVVWMNPISSLIFNPLCKAFRDGSKLANNDGYYHLFHIFSVSSKIWIILQLFKCYTWSLGTTTLIILFTTMKYAWIFLVKLMASAHNVSLYGQIQVICSFVYFLSTI